MRLVHITLVGAYAVLCACSGASAEMPDAHHDASDLAFTPRPADLESRRDLAGNEFFPVDFAIAPDLAPCAVPDLGAPDLNPVAPEAHAAFFQLPSAGGPIIPAMEAWTIVWTGDEAEGAQLNAFLDWMLTSDYWGKATEYGVGPGAAKGLIVVPGPLPTDDMHLGDTYDALRASGALPPPNANTALFFVLPRGVFVSCPCWGYHNYLLEGTTPVPFEVQTGIDPAGFMVKTFDDLTSIVSHEAIEMATDPLFDKHPAYFANIDGSAFSTVSELADLCETTHPKEVSVATGTGAATYTVARFYSNATAAAGTSEPCVPVPNRPFFGVSISAVPVCGDAIATLDAFSSGAQAMLKVDIGFDTFMLVPGQPIEAHIGVQTGLAFASYTSDPAHPEYGDVTTWHRLP
jgi:hypothetical protein